MCKMWFIRKTARSILQEFSISLLYYWDINPKRGELCFWMLLPKFIWNLDLTVLVGSVPVFTGPRNTVWRTLSTKIPLNFFFWKMNFLPCCFFVWIFPTSCFLKRILGEYFIILCLKKWALVVWKKIMSLIWFFEIITVGIYPQRLKKNKIK